MNSNNIIYVVFLIRELQVFMCFFKFSEVYCDEEGARILVDHFHCSIFDLTFWLQSLFT